LLVAVPVSLFNRQDNLALWQSFGVYPIAASLGLLLLAIKVPRDWILVSFEVIPFPPILLSALSLTAP